MGDYKTINIRNKRATFDYEILEEFVAGVVLVGTEIKSVRLGKASMVDSYCYFDKGELWIRNVTIAEYHWGTCNNHVPKRDRKLLRNRITSYGNKGTKGIWCRDCSTGDRGCKK